MFKRFEDASLQFGRLWSKKAGLTALVSAFALSGCATFSPDGGMSVVAEVAGQTIKKDVVAIRSTEDATQAKDAVRDLLRRGLTVDTAVQIALLNNRGLQATYNELALAETDLVQESLPPNPTFSISRIAGRRRGRDRAPGCWRHPRAGNAAVPLGNRAATLPAGAIACRVGDAAARVRCSAILLPRGCRQ